MTHEYDPGHDCGGGISEIVGMTFPSLTQREWGDHLTQHQWQHTCISCFLPYITHQNQFSLLNDANFPSKHGVPCSL